MRIAVLGATGRTGAPLRDGAATGRLEHDAHRSTRSTSITRGDLAAFLADVVEQDLYPRQAPFVASRR